MSEKPHIPVTCSNEVIGYSIQDVLGNAFVTVMPGQLSPSDEINTIFSKMKEHAAEKHGDAVVGLKVHSTTEQGIVYGGAIVSLQPDAKP